MKTLLAMGVGGLLALATPAHAGDAPPAGGAAGGLQAVVLETGATAAEAQAALARYRAARAAALLRAAHGYPRVVAPGALAGLPAGRHAVVLGVCAGAEAARVRDVLALSPGAPALHAVAGAAEAACPEVVAPEVEEPGDGVEETEVALGAAWPSLTWRVRATEPERDGAPGSVEVLLVQEGRLLARAALAGRVRHGDGAGDLGASSHWRFVEGVTHDGRGLLWLARTSYAADTGAQAHVLWGLACGEVREVLVLGAVPDPCCGPPMGFTLESVQADGAPALEVVLGGSSSGEESREQYAFDPAACGFVSTAFGRLEHALATGGTPDSERAAAASELYERLVRRKAPAAQLQRFLPLATRLALEDPEERVRQSTAALARDAGTAGRGAAVAAWRAALDGKDGERQLRAMEALETVGDAGLRARLQRLVRGPGPAVVRAAAALKLAPREDARARARQVAPLLGALGSPQGWERREAARLLGETAVATPQVEAALLAALAHEPERGEAARALGALRPSSRAVLPLVRLAVSDADERARLGAAQALCDAADHEEALPVLQEAATATAADTRRNAAQAFGRTLWAYACLPDEAVLGTLLTLSADTEAPVRLAATHALDALGRKDSLVPEVLVARLVALVGDPHEPVREAAAAGLAEHLDDVRDAQREALVGALRRARAEAHAPAPAVARLLRQLGED